eukprot:scaffold2268_cov349-Prasinococcus_capsulatus_cf.AAC.10
MSLSTAYMFSLACAQHVPGRARFTRVGRIMPAGSRATFYSVECSSPPVKRAWRSAAPSKPRICRIRIWMKGAGHRW